MRLKRIIEDTMYNEMVKTQVKSYDETTNEYYVQGIC